MFPYVYMVSVQELVPPIKTLGARYCNRRSRLLQPMRCNLYGAVYAMQPMWCNMWCKLRGAIYVARSTRCIRCSAMYAVLPMWYNLCGATYAVQPRKYNICGTIYV
eukprot:9162113-Pyramimonas_sp.AAC.1